MKPSAKSVKGLWYSDDRQCLKVSIFFSFFLLGFPSFYFPICTSHDLINITLYKRSSKLTHFFKKIYKVYIGHDHPTLFLKKTTIREIEVIICYNNRETSLQRNSVYIFTSLFGSKRTHRMY